MAFSIVESSTGTPRAANLFTVLVESAADVADIPEEAAPGSIALTPTLGYLAIKGMDGQWHEREIVEAAQEARDAAAAANAAAEAASSSAAAEAIEAANAAAAAAASAATAATSAATAAQPYAKDHAVDNAAMRMYFSILQALSRSYEKRITELETKVRTLAGT